MLYKEAVEPGTLELIVKLQNDPLIKDFYLVGGTALALQLGHRTSVDIDLFTRSDFDIEIFIEHLESNYAFSLQFSHGFTLKGVINGVFVDFLKHDYEYVVPPVIVDRIKMLDKPDIVAMKVNAITGNGTRIKDFIDIYYLLRTYSFEEIMHYYSLKYNKRNTFHAVKSLTYFNDIDEAEWPKMIKEPQLDLISLKAFITKKRDDYLNQK